MSSLVICKIHSRGYLVHANKKTVSGFSIASEPFNLISDDDFNKHYIAIAVKSSLVSDDNKRVPDPTNWSEFKKGFLKSAGLKSTKELYRETTKCCIVVKENGNIVFTPTKHEDKPDVGFSHKGKDEAVAIPYSSPDEEIMEAFKLALSRCE